MARTRGGVTISIIVNDLALLFTGTDPKQKCFVYLPDGRLAYSGRVESLIYRSEEPLKSIGKQRIASLSIIDMIDEEDPECRDCKL